ncbi:MAG: hypothetical protein HY940_05490 [Gammaproteobacteria bacterium]|nr:hypothetical protein [Gammaproteobacteria bacterium]
MLKISGKKITKIFLIVIFIIFLSYLISYIAVERSDAFLSVENYIAESVIVNNELGGNIEIQLSPFGYELEYSGDQGSAKFQCIIQGKKGQGKGFFVLNKINNIWKIEAAIFYANGKQINI